MSTHESYGIIKLEPPDPDYVTFSFTVRHAEGGPDEMIPETAAAGCSTPARCSQTSRRTNWPRSCRCICRCRTACSTG